MKSKYYIVFFVNIVSLFSAAVFAQVPITTTAKAVPNKTTSTNTMAVVADVNLTNVKVVTSTTSLQVSFALQSFRGQQNDIVYGVSVYDDNFNILAVQNEGAVTELPKGIVLNRNFIYPLPTFITGKVKIFLEATTGSGLRLGSKQIWSGELKGKRSFDCKYLESLKAIQCSSSVNQKLTANYKAESIYSIKYLADIKEATKESTTTFDPKYLSQAYPTTTLPAGDYNTIISNEKGENQVLQLTVDGEYGTIKNVMVFQKKKGKVETTIFITANLNAKIDSTLSFSIKLLNTEGELCAEKTLPVSMTVLQATFDTSCTKGKFIATLLGSDGEVLDTTSQPYAVLSVVEEKLATTSTLPKQQNKIPVTTALAIIIVLFALGGAGLYLRKKMIPTITN